MDKQLLEKVFVRLDECSTAAEDLSKSFNKFNGSSKMLEENIKKIMKFDQNLKNENTLKTLSTVTIDIKKLVEFFNKTLPDLKQEVLDSKSTLFENKETITQTIKELIRYKDEISEIVVIVEYLKGIHENIKEIASINIHQDIEQLKGIAEKYTTLTSEIKTLLHENARNLNDQFKEFQNIKDEIKKEVALVEDFRKELKGINDSIQAIKADIAKRDTDISKKVLSFNQTLAENTTVIKSLSEEIPLNLKTSQVNLDHKMRDYLDELLKNFMENIEEKLNHNTTNIFKPTTIEDLYKSNNKQLPMKVQKSSWTKYYHFVIEKVIEINGEYKAIGKTYKKDQINREETRPLNQDGFIMYLDE